jgi:divalent metal cation (Fe/Co/Zn/Cd) transporter
VDRGVSLDILSKVKYIAEGLYDDITCHNVRGRRIGNKVFLDMHLSVGGELSVERGHIIAEHITNKLKECIEGLEDVLVHVEPEGVSCDETKSSKKVVRIMNLDEDSSASKGMTTK